MDYKNFYENREEAEFRLSGSVVMYDGDPVYVQTVENHDDETVRLNIATLPLNENGGGKTVRKKIDSPLFNKFRPFDMGNVNFLHNGVISPIRIERTPARTRVQGTTGANCRISMIHKGTPAVANWSMILQNEGFVEMCKGVYPTFREFLDSGAPAVCISSDFTVSKGESGLIGLAYRFDKIGIVNTKGMVFLFPKYKYLKEMLEELKDFTGINTTIFE